MPAKNVGKTDRTIRITLGAALIVVSVFLAGPLQWIAIALGGVLVLTAAIGWCPPYSLLGINTRGPDAV